jgi:hypothetical protein
LARHPNAKSLIRNLPNKIEHVLMKTQRTQRRPVSQWNQGKSMSQFALRSALVCILWEICCLLIVLWFIPFFSWVSQAIKLLISDLF